MRAVAPLESEEEFEDLLLMLKETRGFDFTGYKRSTLYRQVRRRMTLLNLASFGEYRDYLELQPDEFSLLFDSMLINVTSFFRDPLAWQALREKVIPELLSAKSAKAPIRVWSAPFVPGPRGFLPAELTLRRHRELAAHRDDADQAAQLGTHSQVTGIHRHLLALVRRPPALEPA